MIRSAFMHTTMTPTHSAFIWPLLNLPKYLMTRKSYMHCTIEARIYSFLPVQMGPLIPARSLSKGHNPLQRPCNTEIVLDGAISCYFIKVYLKAVAASSLQLAAAKEAQLRPSFPPPSSQAVARVAPWPSASQSQSWAESTTSCALFCC